MSHTVTVRHTFEAGHRLPNLPGKCQSLHGHSWSVEATVSAPAVDPATGTIVQFGFLKKALREWVDAYLDHGMMLGGADPLVAVLVDRGKLFVFDPSPFPHAQGVREAQTDPIVAGLAWPSVESIAELIARVMQRVLSECGPVEGAYVSRVRVSETPTNSATWEADPTTSNVTVNVSIPPVQMSTTLPGGSATSNVSFSATPARQEV